MDAKTIVNRLLESDDEFEDVEDIMDQAAIQSAEAIAPLLNLGFKVRKTSDYEQAGMYNNHKVRTYVTYMDGPPIAVRYGPEREPKELQVEAGIWFTPDWKQESLRLHLDAPWARPVYSNYRWRRYIKIGDPREGRNIERRIRSVYLALNGRRVLNRNRLHVAVREAIGRFSKS